MSTVKQITKNDFALHLDDGRVYTLSNRGYDGADAVLWQIQERNWETMPQSVGEFRCVPYGWDNNLPCRLRDILDKNNLSPGVIRRQMGLIFGQGIHLYRTVCQGGEVIREWVDNAEIQSWMEDWDVRGYIEDILTDYLYLNGCVSLMPLKRGSRLGGKPFFPHLEAVKMKNARLEWVDSGDIRDVRRLLVGDFEHGCLHTGVTPYPVFDPADPAAHRISGRTPLVASTVGTGLFADMVTGDQYLSIILTCNLYKDLYKEKGFESRLLSRSTEDSATVTSVLVPGATARTGSRASVW